MRGINSVVTLVAILILTNITFITFSDSRLRIISVNYDDTISYTSRLDVSIIVEYEVTLQPINVLIGYSIINDTLNKSRSWSFEQCKCMDAWRSDSKYIATYKAVLPSETYEKSLSPNSTILFYVYVYNINGVYVSTINATAPLTLRCENCFKARVIDDQPPNIVDVRFLPKEIRANMTVKVLANITDVSPLRNVTLTTWMWSGNSFKEIKTRLLEIEPGIFSASIKIPSLTEDVWYMLKAEDSFGNIEISTGEIEVVKRQVESLKENIRLIMKAYFPALLTLLIIIGTNNLSRYSAISLFNLIILAKYGLKIL